MNEYLVRFWWTNKQTGFVEKREEILYGKGKNAHKRVANEACRKFGIKHADIIFVSYC